MSDNRKDYEDRITGYNNNLPQGNMGDYGMPERKATSNSTPYIPKLDSVSPKATFYTQWNAFARTLNEQLRSKNEVALCTDIPATFKYGRNRESIYEPEYISELKKAFLKENPDFIFDVGYYQKERPDSSMCLKITIRK